MRGMLNENQLINVFIGLILSFLIVPAALGADQEPMSRSKLQENCSKSIAIFVGEIVKLDLPPPGTFAKAAMIAKVKYRITRQLKGRIKTPSVVVGYCMGSWRSFCNPDASEIQLESFKLHKKLLVFCDENLEEQGCYMSEVSVPANDKLVGDAAAMIVSLKHK
jgi:hypothetical protein